MVRAASKRGVIFNSTIKFVEIMSIYDYTPSEIYAAWFNEEDMRGITEKCFKTIMAMESREHSSKRCFKYCTRGLEGHSTLGRIGKKRNRRIAYATVLEEQERQWGESKEVDFQAISDAYGDTASSCQMWAQVMGNRDAKAADNYLTEDEDEYARLCATTTMYSHKPTESAPLQSSLKFKTRDVIISKSIDTSKPPVDNLAKNLSPKKNARFLSPQARKSFIRASPINRGKGIRDRLLPLVITH